MGSWSTPEELRAECAAPFAPEELKWKPQAVSKDKTKALAIPYVDARVVEDRLDDVFGIEGWQDSYQHLPDGSVGCRLKVRAFGEWVEKEDVGSPSEQPDEGDRRKAAVSDALKRTAVKFGIGRYLYRIPQRWIAYDDQKRKFTEKPQLPDWALPRPKARPAARAEDSSAPPAASAAFVAQARALLAGQAEPPPAPPAAPPQTVCQWVMAQSLRASQAGIGLADDDLADHVHRRMAGDWGEDMADWPEESREDAKRYALEFAERAKRCKGDPERKPTGEEVQPLIDALGPGGHAKWGDVAKALGWKEGLKLPDLRLEQLRDALDWLAKKAAAEKDRAKAAAR